MEQLGPRVSGLLIVVPTSITWITSLQTSQRYHCKRQRYQSKATTQHHTELTIDDESTLETLSAPDLERNHQYLPLTGPRITYRLSYLGSVYVVLKTKDGKDVCNAPLLDCFNVTFQRGLTRLPSQPMLSRPVHDHRVFLTHNILQICSLELLAGIDNATAAV